MTETTLPSPPSPSAAMLRLISGFWVARAIHAMAALGLADHLAKGVTELPALARATGTHERSLGRLLRALAALGLLSEGSERCYELTPVGATLRTEVPGSLRAWAMVTLGEESHRAWGNLLHSLRTGETAFANVFGAGVWEYRAAHPAYGHLFDEAMANLIDSVNAAVLASYAFSQFQRIVDVGGGNGQLLIAVLKASPGVDGVLFDLPHVAEAARGRITEAGLANRCQVVAGDAFQSLPEGADAYVLSRVIHDWDDREATAILANCQRAMAPRGKVLLIERVLPDDIQPTPVVQSHFLTDLNMMVMPGGCERTETEYRELLQNAGLRLARIVPTASPVCLLEATTASV